MNRTSFLKRISLGLVWAILCIPASAQSEFEDFRKSVEAEMASFKQSVEQEYDDFRRQLNHEYAEFMRQTWEEYEMFSGEPVPENEVKPQPPVVYQVPKVSPVQPRPYEVIPIEVVVPPIDVKPLLVKPQPQPVKPDDSVAPEEPVVPEEQIAPRPIEDTPVVRPDMFEFVWLGTQLHISIAAKDKFSLKKVNESSIADCWVKMGDSPVYNKVLKECLQMRSHYKMCDWAYLLMLRALGDSFYGADTNESKLLAAWLFCQSGYEIRLAYQGDSWLTMLLGSEFKIFNQNYYVCDGKRYYIFDSAPAGNSVHIYSRPFKGEQSLSLVINQWPEVDQKASTPRELQATDYTNMKATSSINENLIPFFDSYPTSELNGIETVRWALYARVPLDRTAVQSLYPSLRAEIKGCSQLEAANRLLNWVQTAFQYEYDALVWGRDRTFFAEESLYYPYCDCEDRSVLFSHLVRDLLGLDVLLVNYPDHIATAIGFTEDVNGDYFLLDDKKYVIADPTYIHASVGMTMPRMENATAKVIRI